MRRGRSGIGTELVPLVLILASLAGSLALVIAIHRRFVARASAEKPTVAVVAPPLPASTRPKPIPRPSPAPPEPTAEEPEPPPPPPPEDPTPKVIAKLMAAEADQLLEASRADRKTAELETAKKAALLESERWRRRESLVRLQLDSLETKLHKLETQADELALERDALEKEVDARKALASEARSRPSTAILPHRGQNGTWRRPIVVECVNGMAIVRPQNIGFGLLELSTGFSPATNPFVATVAREAIRIQGNSSPDGQRVTPYIFFLVRPDGIRTYYEARGRLEALGITFGYELADQDWEVDFPDLDDIKTWDGSSPSRPQDLVARSKPSGSSPAEFENLPDLSLNPGTSGAQAQGNDPQSEFTWPPRPRTVPTGGGGRVTLGGSGSGASAGGIGSPGGSRGAGSSPVGGSGNLLRGTGAVTGTGVASGSPGTETSGGGGNGSVKFPGGTSGADTTDPKTGSGGSNLASLIPPRELSLGGPISPLPPAGSTPGSSLPPAPSTNLGQGSADGTLRPGSANPPPPTGNDPLASLPPVVSPRTSPPAGMGSASNDPATSPPGSLNDPADPANAYVFPSPSAPVLNQGGGGTTSPPPASPNQTPVVRHLGPFSRPLAAGIDPSLLANTANPPASTHPADDPDPTQPDNLNPGSVEASSGTTNSSQSASSSPNSTTTANRGSTGTPPPRVIGPGDSSAAPPPGSPPPPLTVGLGTPGSPPPSPPSLPFSMGSPPSLPPLPPETTNPPKPPKTVASPPPPEPFKLNKPYEIVVVCNARGVIVQPGAYRVTTDALKNREGLLKTQIVALVKAKRTAEPKRTIEPSLRFLVQPGGEGTYWTARSQFLLSGLDWPMTMQVADRDHLTILPSESW